ncbi:MAG TPA: hypothetical protein VGE74_12295 [Gemmata sp.]
MRTLTLFALTFVLGTAFADTATACGKRKAKGASVVTYSVPMNPCGGCDGATGAYYGGSYPGSYSSSYYPGSNYPSYYHSGNYTGSPYYGSSYYGSPYSYPNNYGGPALMPRANSGGLLPGIMPFRR